MRDKFPQTNLLFRQLILPQASIGRSPNVVSASAASSSAVALSGKKDKLPADLEVTEVEQPGSRVFLSVKVPTVVCEDCYRRVLAELKKHSKVPGFRPGKKVPESILVNYVGNNTYGKLNFYRAFLECVFKEGGGKNVFSPPKQETRLVSQAS